MLLEKKAEQLRVEAAESTALRATLNDWMLHWMQNELLGSVKPSSFQTYRNQAVRHILPDVYKRQGERSPPCASPRSFSSA